VHRSSLDTEFFCPSVWFIEAGSIAGVVVHGKKKNKEKSV
jgi:hypothetical protein